MTNSLAIYDRYDQLTKAASALQKSGYFKDVVSEAQAIVKVMAGAELGLPPFASMTGIHIIQGKPALGANVVATLVKNDPRYDYQVVRADNDVCTLAWFEHGKKMGESGFTMVEAKAAELTGKDNWRKFPSDMLFARAITRGARRFAPGIFGGAPVYTPEELGADVDPDGYIDSTAVDVSGNTVSEAKILRELGYEDVLPPAPASMKADPSHISQAMRKPEQAKTKEQLEAELYDEIVAFGLCDNVESAKEALKHRVPEIGTKKEKLEWFRTFAGWHYDLGMTVEEAAAKANAGELPK